MPSFFVVVSSGQTTNLTGADYHMRFVKCLTLCRWAADRWGQTTKYPDYPGRLLQISSSSKTRLLYTRLPSSRSRLPCIQATGTAQGVLGPVARTPSITRASSSKNKHLNRTIKQLHYSFFTCVRRLIYLKFDKQQAKQQEPSLPFASEASAPWGWGAT